MKNIIRIVCCTLGGVMIGFFANQLNTILGCVCFTVGIALSVGSGTLIS